MITITTSTPSLVYDEPPCDPSLTAFVARLYTNCVDALLSDPESIYGVLCNVLDERVPVDGCNVAMLMGETGSPPFTPEFFDWTLMEYDESGRRATTTGTQMPGQAREQETAEQGLRHTEAQLVAAIQHRYQPEPVGMVLHWLLLGSTAICLFRVQKPSSKPQDFAPEELALLDALAPYLARLLNIYSAIVLQGSSYQFFGHRTAELAKAYNLTVAESRILHKMITGGDNVTIARTMGVSLATVKTHITHLLAKIECRNRNALLGLYFSSIDLFPL